MDANLVPLMGWLTVFTLAAVAYATWTFWSARRAVAWNVVNAALTLRQMSPAEVAALEQAVLEMLPGTSLSPKAFHGATPAVRLAYLSMAMQRQGVAPFDAAQPFKTLKSPNLARSARGHIVAVKTLAELKHGITLTELE